jgi:hypothetical protein
MVLEILDGAAPRVIAARYYCGLITISFRGSAPGRLHPSRQTSCSRQFVTPNLVLPLIARIGAFGFAGRFFVTQSRPAEQNETRLPTFAGRCRRRSAPTLQALPIPLKSALLRAMDTYPGRTVTRCALRLAPLTFVRPGELRQAESGWQRLRLDGLHPLGRWCAHLINGQAPT